MARSFLAWMMVAACVAMGPGLARAQADFFSPGALADLQITADKFEMDRQSGWTVATGHVRIKNGLHALEADKVRLHEASGEVEATGNVVMRREHLGDWRGETLSYNYKTGKGLSGDGAIAAGDFHLVMRSMQREEDGTVRLDHAEMTTCTNAPGHRHWYLSASKIRLRENDYADVYGAVPWFFGVPVAYLPYWYRDLNTHYGLRLMPGYTSDWGAFLLGAYVFNIYDQPRGNKQVDAKTHVDLYSQRGVGLGQDIDWRLEQFGAGSFEAYYIQDQDVPSRNEYRNWYSDVDENRYRFAFRHDVDLSPRDQLWARGTYLSDSEVMNDFYESAYRGESQSINHLAYEHREHSWILGSVASGPLNDFYAGVARLPEAWVNLMPQTFGVPGLYYMSQTRAGYLKRYPAEFPNAAPGYRYLPGVWADYDAARVDTRHLLKRPVNVVEGVTLTPRAGWRGTAYDDAETVPGKEHANKTRSLVELGAELSAKATADYTSIRHTVNPYLDYAYIPEPSGAKDGSLYAFDRVERSYEWRDQFGQDGLYPTHEYNGIRTGLRNIFQDLDKRDRPALFDWDVYTAYLFENGTERWKYVGRDQVPLYQEESRDTGSRLVGSRATWQPAKDFKSSTVVEFDPENGDLAFVDLNGQYTVERWQFHLGYLARDNEVYDYYWRDRLEDAVVYGGLVHRLTDAWTWSTFARQNTQDGGLEEVGGYLQYSLDCLTFQLRGSYLPSYTCEDGTEFSDDYRIGFMMWLNAAPTPPEQGWMRW